MRRGFAGRVRTEAVERSLEALFPYAALREEILRTLKRLGWIGGTGAGLLLAALVIDLAVTAGNYRAHAQLEAERGRLSRLAAQGAAPSPPSSPAEAFYAGFPEQSDLPRSLARLSEIAAANAMNIVRADYRAVEQPGTPLVHMTLSLPVQGNYAALHGGLAEILAAMPEVGLEALSLRRVDRAADLVDGEVRLAVYARRP